MKAEGGGGGDGDGGEEGAAVTAKQAAEAEAEAVDVVACLKERGLIRGYGAARLVPRRDYDLAELRLNKIEAEKLLSPNETTIQVRQCKLDPSLKAPSFKL